MKRLGWVVAVALAVLGCQNQKAQVPDEKAQIPVVSEKARNDKIRAELLRLLDKGNGVRKVTFYAYFDTRKEADDFGAWAKARGYTIAPAKASIGIKFSTKTTVNTPEFDQETDRLAQEIARRKGKYDGWECEIRR